MSEAKSNKRKRSEGESHSADYEPNLKADSLKIVDILSSKYFLHTNNYQRPYEWLANDVSMLMNDLKQAKENGVLWYFLSTIVLSLDRDKSNKHYIVDGQQRLTTLTILMAVSRHFLPTGEKHFLDGVIKGTDNILTKQKGHFHLNLFHEAKFFQEYVQESDGIEKCLEIDDERYQSLTATQQRIVTCVREIKRCLPKTKRVPKSKIEPDIKEIKDLVSYVLTNCHIVVIEVKDSESQALRIFRTLNARGREISQMDAVKVEFLQRISEEDGQRIDQVGREWESMLVHLGEERFSDLFKMLYCLHTNNTSPSSQSKLDSAHEKMKAVDFFDGRMVPLYKTMLAIINNNVADDGDDDESMDLNRDAHVHDQSDLSDVVVSLEYLKILPNEDWKIVAIPVLAKYKYGDAYTGCNKSCTAQHVKNILKALLNRYAWMWMDHDDGKSDIKQRNKLKKALMELLPESKWEEIIKLLKDFKDKQSVIDKLSKTKRVEKFDRLNRFLLLRVNEEMLVESGKTRLNLGDQFASTLICHPLSNDTSKRGLDVHSRIGFLSLNTSGAVMNGNDKKLFKSDYRLPISDGLTKINIDGIAVRHIDIMKRIAHCFDLPIAKWDSKWKKMSQ
ncbi:DBP3 [Acrasis kona]|uniref:DBP3 n=1 Tax=Acrasis kona TaxID=1008807 RepID=A0AAW2Z8S0_9EUKA